MIVDKSTDTLYLTGTRINNLQDLDADVRDFLNNIDTSYKYNMASNYVLQHGITNVVGYSLGGALADKLTSNIKHIKHAIIYNSPSITYPNNHKTHMFSIMLMTLYRGYFITRRINIRFIKVHDMVIL